MRLPKTFLTWILRMPEELEQIARRNAQNEEDVASNLWYLRWKVTDRLEEYPLEKEQTFDGCKWKGVPCVFDDFDGTDIHLHVFVNYPDHSYKRIDATIRMGQKIKLPYNVNILDDNYDPITLTLELIWPMQASFALPLVEQARKIASERDWTQYVLEQCQQIAKGVGSYNLNNPGLVMVKVGRNHQRAEEVFKQYDPKEFSSQFEADVQSMANQLKDVTIIVICAKVYYESEPTEWEHIAYDISYNDYQKRTRISSDTLEYEVNPEI